MPDPSPDKPNLSTHPLVTKLHGDSDPPPSLVALTGYFGPSKNADSIRLYPSLDFQSYFEIPKAAIVATTPVDSKDDQSPTIVHVKAGTPVASVQTSTQPVESYLQGGITGSLLEFAGAAAGAVPQPTPTAVPTHFRCVHPTPTVTFAPCCPITHPPCSGVYTQCCRVHPTAAPVCTQIGCPHPNTIAGDCTLVRTVCACPQPAAAALAAAQPTPTITFAPCCQPITHPPCSGVQTQCCPIQNTAETLCTQIGCATHNVFCHPTNIFQCHPSRICPTNPPHFLC